MLTNNIFMRKTKRGNILKVSLKPIIIVSYSSIVEVMFDFILEMCSFSRLFASIIYERIFGVARQYVNIATSESTIKCLPMH